MYVHICSGHYNNVTCVCQLIGIKLPGGPFFGGGGGCHGDGIRHYVPYVFVVVLYARHLPHSPFEIPRN